MRRCLGARLFRLRPLGPLLRRLRRHDRGGGCLCRGRGGPRPEAPAHPEMREGRGHQAGEFRHGRPGEGGEVGRVRIGLRQARGQGGRRVGVGRGNRDGMRPCSGILGRLAPDGDHRGGALAQGGAGRLRLGRFRPVGRRDDPVRMDDPEAAETREGAAGAEPGRTRDIDRHGVPGAGDAPAHRHGPEGLAPRQGLGQGRLGLDRPASRSSQLRPAGEAPTVSASPPVTSTRQPRASLRHRKRRPGAGRPAPPGPGRIRRPARARRREGRRGPAAGGRGGRAGDRGSRRRGRARPSGRAAGRQAQSSGGARRPARRRRSSRGCAVPTGRLSEPRSCAGRPKDESIRPSVSASVSRNGAAAGEAWSSRVAVRSRSRNARSSPEIRCPKVGTARRASIVVSKSTSRPTASPRAPSPHPVLARTDPPGLL